MTVRVHNGQDPTAMIWHNRNGVLTLEPPDGWVNPTTIRAYFWTLTPRARAELLACMALWEEAKTEEELRDDLAYDLAILAQKPLTP